MSDIVLMRDIDIITTEIKVIEQQVAKAAIYGCIEIGKRLVEAKEMVGHGGWGKYLEEKVRYSQQWATNLMNLYREYGSSQESLFENFANSQSFGNIDVTKHILLLSVPVEERERFAAEHDAENATTRELQAAIRDRDANLRAAQEQQDRAEKAEHDVEDLKKGLEALMDTAEKQDEAIAELQAQVKAAEDKQADADVRVEKLKDQLAKAKALEKSTKAALDYAKANPKIPEAMMESLRSEVAAEAAKKATEDLQKQLDALNKEKAAADAVAQDAKAKLEAAEKRLALSSPEAAVFKSIFQQVQEDFKKLTDTLDAVKAAQPETGEKLRGAVKKLLEKLLNDIGA